MLKTGGIIIQQEGNPGSGVRRGSECEPGRERAGLACRTVAGAGIQKSLRDATPRVRRDLRALLG
jgi:hypothetical protein